MDESTQPIRRARFGPFEADFSLRQISKHGIRIKLHDQPLQVLAMLVARPGELVTREEMGQKLWPAGTFVDFDNGLNSAVNRLREALGDSADAPKYVETIPRRGYRFIATVEILDGLRRRADDLRKGVNAQPHEAGSQQPPAGSLGDSPAPSAPHWAAIGRWPSKHKYLLGAAAIVVLVAAGAQFLSTHRTHALTDRDTIVIADFANSTGDAVFDDTLKQGLSIQLAQSPFLNILAEERVNETLRLMERSPGDRFTGDVAREVCQRTGSKAVLAGSIASLGSQYVIGLKARSCASGDFLVQEQVQAARKEDVLKALDTAATRLRTKLGESLSTVQKFDTPLERATTTSFEALKAYSEGRVAFYKGPLEMIPFLQRAIEIDPNFAAAHSSLGSAYIALRDRGLGEEHIARSYQLRDHASEREKLGISTSYYIYVTGELGKALQTYDVWAQEYPRDDGPSRSCSMLHSILGQHEKALPEMLEAVRLNPDNYNVLGTAYLNLDRISDAKSAYQEALSSRFGPNHRYLQMMSYLMAFLQDDRAEMERLLAWNSEKPGTESRIMGLHASTEAFAGRLGSARDLIRRASESALRNDQMEAAAGLEAEIAGTEADFGNLQRARQDAATALASTPARHVEALAGLAMARGGDSTRAETIADDLAKRFPLDTIINGYSVPTLRAAVELNRKNPAKAVEYLESTSPYELAQNWELYAVYLRGEAYLALHKGNEAAAEFQKILAHRGIVLNAHQGALAHLGLARALALEAHSAQGADTENYKTKARVAYADFLTLWKDADPDIPILRAAKTEYAKLR